MALSTTSWPTESPTFRYGHWPPLWVPRHRSYFIISDRRNTSWRRFLAACAIDCDPLAAPLRRRADARDLGRYGRGCLNRSKDR